MAAFNLASKMAAKLSFQSFLSSLYATRERYIRKIRHSDPGCSDIWILRGF